MTPRTQPSCAMNLPWSTVQGPALEGYGGATGLIESTSNSRREDCAQPTAMDTSATATTANIVLRQLIINSPRASARCRSRALQLDLLRIPAVDRVVPEVR